jgi:hypothetical protein
MDDSHKKNGVTRQELYDLVWSEPMIGAAAKPEQLASVSPLCRTISLILPSLPLPL